MKNFFSKHKSYRKIQTNSVSILVILITYVINKRNVLSDKGRGPDDKNGSLIIVLLHLTSVSKT